MRFYPALTFVFLFSLVGPAWAVDGVVDINQARASAGGVSPGDTAGFPVTISQAGSYRLTGNLTVPDADTTAIQITASNVTLDLNGFGILGPVVCSGSPVTSCAPAASGFSGSGVTVAAGESVTVLNGTVQGMGWRGVAVGAHSRVENVRAVSNGAGGITTGTNCTIRGNIAARNGVTAFTGGFGIDSSGRSVLSDNATDENQKNGITCGSECTVTGNTATGNGECGVRVLSSGTLTGNTATSNTGFGMCFDDGGNNPSGYANNVLNANNGGNANPQLYGGVQMGTNVCGGDAVCP